MEQALQKIKEASEGLCYISETDHPFELFQFKATSASLEEEILSFAGREKGIKVEKVTLEHFFRNRVKVYPDAAPEQQEMTSRYHRLQTILQEELQDVSVYRIGEVVVDVFIMGKLPHGVYGGLRTKVVET